MKWLTLILAFYITGLASMSCSDSRTYTGPVQLALTSQDSDSHRDLAQDLCSPLCICSCCHGLSLGDGAEPIQFGLLTSLPKQQPVAFHSEKSLSVLLSFWQPPQV